VVAGVGFESVPVALFDSIAFFLVFGYARFFHLGQSILEQV
jgi:hypothetical protein